MYLRAVHDMDFVWDFVRAYGVSLIWEGPEKSKTVLYGPEGAPTTLENKIFVE